MKLRAKNNTMLIRPVYAPWARLSPLASIGETIQTKEFGAVQTHGSQAYVNTKPGNHIGWGEVLDVGPGAVWMRDNWPAGKPKHTDLIRVGDVIGFDQCQEVSLKFQGEDTFFIPCEAALCRFNDTDAIPVPLQHYILTREEEDAGRRFTFSSAASKFHLPRNSASGSIKVSDSPTSQVKFAVERVVSVGSGGMGHEEIRTERSVHLEERLVAGLPGGEISLRLKAMGVSAFIQSKVIEKRQVPVWIEPDRESVGHLALFLHTMSIDVTVQGVRHRLSNWQRVRSLVDEEDSDTRATMDAIDAFKYAMARGTPRAGTLV